MFEIIKKDKLSRARVGTLTMPHGGVAQTPSYVVVGTHAKVRTLGAEDLAATKTQMVISNTYHLWRTLGGKLDSYEGLHKALGWNGIVMTDSGGFQVFSLGFAREHGVGKIAPMFPEANGKKGKAEDNLVTITKDGAYFMDGGERCYLDAERSVAIQEKLGADIILAFDECTSPLHSPWYTFRALQRTHAWAKRCLTAKRRKDQMLYGIVQGGAFWLPRTLGARFIGSLPFDGFAIGGSLGKSRSEMMKVLKWSMPHLPEEKPRHLLGIGKVDDLFDGVEHGIDTFDCVIPTREARHGCLWTLDGRFDVKRGKNRGAKEPIDPACGCPVCKGGRTKGELYERFHAKDAEAGRLATLHNVYFFNDLMEKIRHSILEDRFVAFKKETLARITRK